MRKNRLFTVVLTSILMLTFSTLTWAQSGSISGTVSDKTGAVIPAAQVLARDIQTGISRTTATNSQGFYEFLNVKPSTYELTVEMKGFEKAIKHDISVIVGHEAHFDVTLTPGNVSETIEVKTEVPLIEPDKTNVSYSIDKQQIENLPLQGRQFLDLALLTPGVTPQAPGTQAGGINVSGMRSQSNNFTLDGVSNNDPQVNGPLNNFRIADAVQEFNVNTSIASTDLGRSAGAAVAIVTKSGTNTYHGTLFYDGRNEALDANDWFLNRAGKPKNELRRHQYGGTIGGYLIKNRTFWFFSYEGFRQKNPSPQTATVPTLAMRAQVTDPVSAKLLQFIPNPNFSSPLTTDNWAGTVDQFNNNQTYLLHMDHNLTENNRLSGHYIWNSGTNLSLQTNPFNGNITNTPGSQSTVIDETFSHGKWLNVVRLGAVRNVTDFGPQDIKINPSTIFTDASGNPLPGFVDTKTSPLNGGLPRITVTGLNNFGLGAGTNMPQGRTTNTYQIIDNVSWIHGNHTLQFGGEAREEQTFRFLNGNFRGAIAFRNWTDFAKGNARTGSLRTGGPDQTFRTWTRRAYYMYAQDSWKVKSNLTFNYGLRYELPGAMVEKNDSGSNFVPGVGIMKLNSNLRVDINPLVKGPGAITLTPVNAFLPRSGQFDNATKNFAPFIGVAWSPKILRPLFGDGQTVVRSGFRLSYDDFFSNVPVNMGLNFPPVLSTTLPTGNYPWSGVLNQNRFFTTIDATGAPVGILGFNAWDTAGKTSYAMNYALEIERQVGKNYAVQASYIGTQGRKLGIFLDANEPFLNIVDPTKIGSALPNKRSFPFPQLSGISIGSFGSNSNYNGMVLTVKKKPSHGLSLQASYTLGKSLDNNSSFFGSTGEAGAFADSRNPRADYGPSAFDVRHQVIVAYLYELPFGRGRTFLRDSNHFLDAIAGGWDISGITNWHTGFPFTVFAGTSTDFSGFNQFVDRPIAGPGTLPISFDNPSHVFPTSFFSSPAAGNVGNVGRNAYYGPSYTDFDFSLLKNFRIAESKKFQFRADFFNLFNHANFDLPVSNLASAAAGTITSDNNANPRLVQLGLRFNW